MAQPSTDHPGQIKTLQIITFALIQGVVVFAAVAFFISQGKEQKEGVLVWVALGIAIMAIVVRTVLGGFLTSALRNGLDRTVWDELPEQKKDSRLIGQFQTKHIIECALLEGAAFFNLVIYIIERNMISLGVAAVLLMLMAMAFPGGSKVDHWVENQKQLINIRA